MEDRQYFLIWCIEAVKRIKGISGSRVYNKLKECDCLKFIIDNYEVIHSESEEYIVEDIVEFCKNRGVLFK
ncbi:DUF3791 domain-containing protein [Clostridium tagluense]|uniref:DUF3791 domain-containing protein n=1 Tax=Clostridium tagluense TaxID=360422 RepID=UPI001CF312D9|nr:DUF3791 domain-containing protein [Clostridium tagluense]MCB2313343.1 DUF3791 domain-containing protein [Clostridium tagluense]MCB2318167.1 DUF3791 domain-containing protein [Clostridium tagluense]MCB2323007.1 DUF3791 domain-containing protein [Clostridium tagluense]MCB2327951.1 DUF3791 domain-containing protein [Clostridium tagluense]MCB2332709.1 DUF3791 domain-containing protein [Clostridium tagluense]